LLDCTRRIAEYDRATGAKWAWDDGRPIHRFPGTTLGLVSFGPIARRVHERLAGFDLDVIAYDPYVEADEMAAAGVEKVDFEELLARADYLSLHAPLTDETEGLIDADALAAMAEHAILVNTARVASSTRTRWLTPSQRARLPLPASTCCVPSHRPRTTHSWRWTTVS
jgi:D-3-phosphoglycerate dehydrogenase